MGESASVRKELLASLLAAVQQCQVRYGGKSELATENEEVVSNLCRALEAVFSHGLKPEARLSASSALRQMTDLVSSNFGGFISAASTSTDHRNPEVMWTFIKAHLNKHELERFMLLKSVSTDAGRGRAWLRASLNEHSLERYVHLFLGEADLLKKHYDSHSFLLDQERSALLPSMAAGLGSILFAISIDNPVLNTSTDPFAKNSVDEMPIVASVKNLPKNVSGSSPDTRQNLTSSKKLRKKSRKIEAHIADIDNEDETERSKLEERSQSPSSELRVNMSNSSSIQGGDEDGSPSPLPSLSYDPVKLKELPSRSILSARESIAEDDDTDDFESVYSRSMSEGDHTALSKLTPIKNADIGGLIPVSVNGKLPHDIQSDDSASIRSFGEGSDYGSVFTDVPPPSTSTSAQSKTLQSAGVKVEKSKGMGSRASSIGSTISREDLKQALLSVMSRKDELQSQCEALRKLLEQETSVVAGLNDELREVRRKCNDSIDKLNVRVQTLTRENELLKHQLKKYVGAVQKLRDGPMAYETLAQLEGHSGASRSDSSTKYVDYHFEASEFEKKLIQAAEMHGELLEFNEHLQKTLQAKDNYIRRLRDELVELRGPLPSDDLDRLGPEETMSLHSEVESVMTQSFMSISSQGKFGLINIWIPSVFLSGTGNRTHHVYQVYLKIGLEEWNIYRRYSEFYALHKDLQQRDRAVSGFDFPPKKSVGYKTEKVVEDRRKRLQAYLRCVVNLMIQTNPSLLSKPDKEHVLLLMPFFAETSSVMGHTAASPSMIPQLNQNRIFRRQGATTSTAAARGCYSEPAPQLAL